MGALFPFLPLLLEERGLAPDRIAQIMVLGPVANLFVPAIWGVLADVLHARIQLLRLACAGAALSALLLLPAKTTLACMLAMAAFSFFRTPISALSDAIAWNPAEGRRGEYGHVRVWGSVGFAGAALLLGQLRRSIDASVIVAATSAAYMIAAALTFPLRTAPVERTVGVLRHAAAIVLRPQVGVFLVATAAYYTAHGAYDAFFSMHLRTLGFGDGFIGVAWAWGVAAEIAVMTAAPRIVSRVPAGWLLVGCSAVAVARWLLLAQVHGAAPLLATQTLHGVTFGLWYLALVDFTQSRAPDHLRTSLQSVVAAALSVGMIGGYLAGGSALASGGGKLLFLLAAIASSAAFAGYLAAVLLARTERCKS